MIERSLSFSPTDQYAYPINQSTLHICMKTRGKCYFCTTPGLWRDQYDWVENRWVTECISMICTGTDALFDYWHMEGYPASRNQ